MAKISKYFADYCCGTTPTSLRDTVSLKCGIALNAADANWHACRSNGVKRMLFFAKKSNNIKPVRMRSIVYCILYRPKSTSHIIKRHTLLWHCPFESLFYHLQANLTFILSGNRAKAGKDQGADQSLLWCRPSAPVRRDWEESGQPQSTGWSCLWRAVWTSFQWDCWENWQPQESKVG